MRIETDAIDDLVRAADTAARIMQHIGAQKDVRLLASSAQRLSAALARVRGDS